MQDQSITVADVEYRDIPGFVGYRIGNDGSVWSCRVRGPGSFRIGKWYRMKATKSNSTGHVRVGLYNGKSATHCFIHRLVLEAFVGPCPEGMECRHFPDGDPTNNHVGNLIWGTPKQNAADRMVQGSERYGVANNKAKLTDELVREIRTRYSSGGKQVDLAEQFGVSQAVISCVIMRKTWKHVE